MINVLSMLFSVVLIKSTKKVIQRTFIEDDLHVDGLKFPANNDTDKFEELNQNVSVNMFEVDDENVQAIISRKLSKKMLNAILMRSGLMRMIVVFMCT